MIVGDLINDMVPPLKLNDEISKAIVWMEELRLNELPVVDKSQFIGFVQEDFFISEEDFKKTVADFELNAKSCYIEEDKHLYDLLKTAKDHNLGSVAVVNSEGQYVGVVSVNDTLSVFADSATIQSPGGIIILSMLNRDYSLSQISRLIEAEDAKIIGSFINADPMDGEKLHLTLKINKIDLSHILATLERFGFQVFAHFQETSKKTNEKERIDILLKYLSI